MRTSIGGESEVESEALEVRVRWRYVKGGLRMVMLLRAGGALVFKCAVCEISVSAGTDSMAGARMASV